MRQGDQPWWGTLVTRFQTKTRAMGTRTVVVGEMYLNDERTMGLPFEYDEGKYLSLGEFKLAGRPRENVQIEEDFGFNPLLLYLAMDILHRRKIFELGIYDIKDGWSVIAVKNGDKMVLLAPCIEVKDSIPFEELVENYQRETFDKWKEWRMILLGKGIRKI